MAEVKRQGLTHAELAQRVGTYRSHMTAYLTGSRDLNGKTLDRVFKALGLAVKPTKRKGGK